MTSILLLVLSLPTGNTPCEALEPAYQFGTSYHAAKANQAMASVHRAKVVSTFESWCESAWAFRQDRVQFAWQEMATALNETLPHDDRVRALNRVRETIGLEAFEARAMPSAIPNYLYAVTRK